MSSIMDLENIFFQLDQAIVAIPNLKIYQKLDTKNKKEILVNPYLLFEEYEDFGTETMEKITRLIRDTIINKASNLRE